MPNRNAEKIRRRREKLLADKTPAAVPRSNNLWFWLLLAVFLSTTVYLVYQSVTNNAANEMILPIIISIIAFLVVIVWFLPKFYVRALPDESGTNFDREKERLKLEDDTRKTVAQIVGGAVILGSLIFSYNTYHLQQEGQFTDRFTKAVAQLGDDKLEVRLGGLYALERIAKDSPKDHWTVMEILSAFVREKAKKKEEPVKNNISNQNVNNDVDDIKQNTKVTTDIQTALTIIGRRKTKQDLKTSNIDLSNTNLSESYLYIADLIRVNLSGADLSEADLSGAELTNANLTNANLTNANLIGARLYNSKITFEQLSQAIINEYTILPYDIKNRRVELLEISKKNFEKRKNRIDRLIQ